jgi:adenylate cyclase
MNQSMCHPIEIERKFLLSSDAWREQAVGTGRRISQGYLSADGGRSVRVRIDGAKATLTVKGPRVGISRPELQYLIPLAEGQTMLGLCYRPLIEKTRYNVFYEGMKWEIDEFHAENEGLLVAEVELDHVDQVIALPDWVGQEVSDDQRYYNSCLARAPFSTWDA